MLITIAIHDEDTGEYIIGTEANDLIDARKALRNLHDLYWRMKSSELE